MLHGLVIVQYRLAEPKASKNNTEEFVERVITGQAGYDRLPPRPEGLKFPQDLRVPVDLNSGPENIDGLLPLAGEEQNSSPDQVMFGVIRFCRN